MPVLKDLFYPAGVGSGLYETFYVHPYAEACFRLPMRIQPRDKPAFLGCLVPLA